MATEPNGSDGLAGRAYGYRAQPQDNSLAQCGPGTLGGELLRRYWQPIARSEELIDVPRATRLLGEDLVLFRDRQGRAGLLYPRCMHRGTNLVFGKIENAGLRCSYHGWLFDTQGRCVEAPCEAAGPPTSLRQPWYPVVEHFGLIWTYMGPAEQEPCFPRISLAENLHPDDELLAGGSMDAPQDGPIPDFQDFNWWQSYENLMDPLHVYILHSRINGIQFDEDWALYPETWFEKAANGVVNFQRRRRPDGTDFKHVFQGVLPNINCSGSERGDGRSEGMIVWHVPRDDESFRVFTLSRRSRDPETWVDSISRPSWGPGKPANEWTIEDHQRWQNDYTVLKGQGDIQSYSEQHLTLADRGIAILRAGFLEQARIVAAGGEPIGASRREPSMLTVLTTLDPPPGLRPIPAPAQHRPPA